MEGKCRVSRSVLQKMLEVARADGSRECCGLLAGCDSEITSIFPAQNALASATAYEIAPQELFALVREIRAQKLEFLGIYHSHPHTESVPSATDIARAFYPDAIYFIISPNPDVPKPIRAFRIRDGNFTELSVEVI
jgi:proteasome lid subunit RPN8/RPN11